MRIIDHPEAIEATDDLIHDLKQAVDEVAFDHMTRLLYSTDASIYQMMPVGVVFPKDTDDVTAVVEIAARHNVPILPRGGGSSLAGQAVGHALILDFSRYMNNIIQIDPASKTVRTQPGITLGGMNRTLRHHGLMFGPDPASADRATIGGVLGNNSTGAHSIIYGMTDDNVIAIDAVLSDASRVTFSEFDSTGDTLIERGQRPGIEGLAYRAIPGILNTYHDEIAARYPQTFRTVSGYNLQKLSADKLNLARLLVGSEGTLGITTEATLQLADTPRRTRLGLVHFSDLRVAMEAVPRILETQPYAIELLDRMLLDLTRDRVEYRSLLNFVQGSPEVILIVEYEGASDKELDAGIDRLRQTLKAVGHSDALIILSDPIQQANVWYVRKVGLGILMSVRGDAKPIPFIEDAAVPVEHLADYITGVFDIAHRTGVERVAMYAHASAGCLHVRPLVNLKTADGVRQLREIAEGSLELVMRFKGTISGEHGDGLVRGEMAAKLFGPKMVQAFRDVKAAFDPENRLNPGKVVDVKPIDDQTILRYGTAYSVPLMPAHTAYRYLDGFDRAVEMCNGAGVCRKLDDGVMCPSYMITRDEKDSTRARANALRAGMMGLLGQDGMTSHEVYDVLDLCLSCKACKAECPSSVDMTKLKAEFLHGYHAEHGVPVRSRIFANIASLNKLGSIISPVTNVMLSGPAKWVMTALGVHGRRALPRLASQPFSRWFKQHTRGQSTTGKEVVLFHDTFMQYNHPEIGQAAVRVLEAGGYTVHIIAEHGCCGRPAMSKGLLDQARDLAQGNVALLAPYIARGMTVVGCEPSCVAALVDEYPDLLPDNLNAQALAENTMLLEDFLIHEAQAGRLTLTFDEQPRSILFHGHCNQKALFGTAHSMRLLSLIPNASVEEIQSGCCGMAGSFGYEREHYDLSIALAEQSLAPTVRSAPPGTIIAATGTSCREQIDHTTGRHALHPIEVLAGALRN